MGHTTYFNAGETSVFFFGFVVNWRKWKFPKITLNIEELHGKNRRLRRAFDPTFHIVSSILYDIYVRKNPWPFKHLHFFVALILILPFVIVDCERSFFAMKKIKTDTRNRLGEILNELMILYDITGTEEEKATIDIKALAEWLAANWNYKKVDKTPWSQAYDQCIV